LSLVSIIDPLHYSRLNYGGYFSNNGGTKVTINDELMEAAYHNVEYGLGDGFEAWVGNKVAKNE